MSNLKEAIFMYLKKSDRRENRFSFFYIDNVFDRVYKSHLDPELGASVNINQILVRFPLLFQIPTSYR